MRAAEFIYVAIVGSRPDPKFGRGGSPLDQARRLAVRDYVRALKEEGGPIVVVSGGAPGVDSWAAEAAMDHGLLFVLVPANWDAHGKRAGPARNAVIVDLCSRLVAFWDGKSRGTADAIAKARLAGKPVEIVGPTNR